MVGADVGLRNVYFEAVLGEFMLTKGSCKKPALILNPLRTKDVRTRKGTLGENHGRRGLEEDVRSGEFGRA
jgi:hypothetical protein